MPTRREEIEKIAAVALAPLVEVAWADGAVTPAERKAVLDAAKMLGVDQHSEFSRTTLRRWLHEAPPTQALEAWRAMLVSTLSESKSRTARKTERRLFEEARNVAKTDARAFGEGGSVDASAGITEEEQRVLDALREALAALPPEDETSDGR